LHKIKYYLIFNEYANKNRAREKKKEKKEANTTKIVVMIDEGIKKNNNK